MGSWGAGLFSNDTAADLKDDFRDLAADGLTAEQIAERLVADYGVGAGNADDNDFWLALALTAHKLGRLTPDVRSTALQIINDPAELERWPAASRRQRRAALDKARLQLSAPLPEPKPVRRRTRVDTNLIPGQHVRWHLSHGRRDVLLRVDGIHQDKGGRYPEVLALDWSGSERELRKAHRLRPLSGGPDPMRADHRDLALGFLLVGGPCDPSEIQVLGARWDRKTPDPGHFRHSYVVPWTDLYRFFTPDGRAAIPPEWNE